MGAINKSLSLTLFLLLLMSSFVLAEEMTITTYYPAPYGSYNELQLYPHSPPVVPCDAEHAGVMFVDSSDDNTLKVCDGSGNWEAAGYWVLDDTLATSPSIKLYPRDLGWNVGIGTADPRYKLTVAGDTNRLLQVQSTDGGSAPGLYINNAGGGGGSMQAPSSGNGLSLHTEDGWRAVNIRPGGLVGIGAGDPQTRLAVAGNMIIGSTFAEGHTAPVDGLAVEGNVGIGSYGTSDRLNVLGGVSIGTYSGAPSMGLLVEGKAGFGTTEPYSLLSVGGNGAGNSAISGIGSSFPFDVGVFGGGDGTGVSGNGGWAGVSGWGDFEGVEGFGGTFGVYGNGPYGGYFEGNTTGVFGGGSTYGVYGFGTAYAGYFEGNVNITGLLTKGGGAFVQPHPTDPVKEIVYAFFEGRDNNVFFTGEGKLKNGKATIEVPEDFQLVASTDAPYNVTLTPYGRASLYVEKRSPKQIDIAAIEKGEDTEFGYMVIAVRGGYERSKPIQENRHFRPDETKDIHGFESRFIVLPTDSYYAQLNKGLNRRLLINNGILMPDGTLNRELAQRLGWLPAAEKIDKKSGK
ncbi:MAG: hypothetical protein ACOY3D_08845 [Candidatus Omnitrophota bacterium]